jgi:NHLM bacteriocin system ABC transporter ATP-binding protein
MTTTERHQILAAWRSGGETMPVTGNRAYLLDEGEFWIIEGGRVDLFTVPLRDGAPDGARTPLFTMGPGEIVLGVPAPIGVDIGMVVVPRMDVTVTRGRLADAPQAGKHGGEAARNLRGPVELWLGRFLRGFVERLRPHQVVQPEAEQTLVVEPGAVIAVLEQEAPAAGPQGAAPGEVSGGFLWANLQAGRLGFLDEPAGSLDIGRAEASAAAAPGVLVRWFPLIPGTWWTARTSVQLAATAAPFPATSADMLEALHHLQIWLMAVLDRRSRLREAEESERLQVKEATGERLFRQAHRALGHIMEGSEDLPAEATLVDDPFLAAVQQVAAATGIRTRGAPGSDSDATNAVRISQCARVMGFQYRKVLLRTGWHREEGTPLLGFRKGDQPAPVVLLPRPGTTYLLRDPLTGHTEKVGPDTLETLEEQAWQFYPLFPPGPTGWREVWGLGLQGASADFSALLLYGTLAALVGLLSPWLTGYVFGTVLPHSDRWQLAEVAVALVVASVTIASFNICRGLALLRIVGRGGGSVQAAVLGRLLTLPIPFFRSFSVGDLSMRTMEVTFISSYLKDAVFNVLFTSVFALWYLVLLFWYSWRLALVGVAFLCLGALINLGCVLLQTRLFRREQNLQGDISGMVLEYLQGISKLRVSATEQRAFANWATAFTEQKKLSFSSGLIGAAQSTILAVLPVLTSLAIFAWFFYYDRATLGLGSFLAFTSALAALQESALQMGSVITTLAMVLPMAERVSPILTQEPEAEVGAGVAPSLQGAIEVTNMSFRYSPDQPVILRNVSLSIRPGEFVAIVGESGAGKTTLFRLLLGFETPTEGGIFFDGVSLDSLDVRELRRQIGVVLQNGQVMSGSIFQNIVGATDLTLKDAERAAEMAGLSKDIAAMPMGMQTFLNAGGTVLSGGQRQRLLIARALARNPRVLLFDEATSALDNETQAIVARSLESLPATRIVIAHRLSTIVNADRIYFFRNGELAECGTPDELMKLGGHFADLARRQIS